MTKYKVIWFDDEFESLNLIREKAYMANIELVGYNNAKDGIEELRRNIVLYDAAIVDGLFLRSKDIGVANVDDRALFDVGNAIETLKEIKVLPWFILSGQLSFTKERNRYADGFKGNEVYDKLDENQLSKLWANIKSEADKQVETEIRLRFSDVFEICNDRFLASTTSGVLFRLLKAYKNNEWYDTEKYMNDVRKVMENLFEGLHGIGVLPGDVWRGKSNISNSARFVAGKHSHYIYKSEILQPVVSHMIQNILDMTQDGSHAAGDLPLRVDEFVKENPTGYLFRSIVCQLLEVLIWFKSFFNSRQDFAANSELTVRKQEDAAVFEATIARDYRDNYFCGDCILTYRYMSENSYAVGDRIIVKKTVENTNPKTRALYPKTIVESQKI